MAIMVLPTKVVRNKSPMRCVHGYWGVIGTAFKDSPKTLLDYPAPISFAAGTNSPIRTEGFSRERKVGPRANKSTLPLRIVWTVFVVNKTSR